MSMLSPEPSRGSSALDRREMVPSATQRTADGNSSPPARTALLDAQPNLSTQNDASPPGWFANFGSELSKIVAILIDGEPHYSRKEIDKAEMATVAQLARVAAAAVRNTDEYQTQCHKLKDTWEPIPYEKGQSRSVRVLCDAFVGRLYPETDPERKDYGKRLPEILSEFARQRPRLFAHFAAIYNEQVSAALAGLANDAGRWQGANPAERLQTFPALLDKPFRHLGLLWPLKQDDSAAIATRGALLRALSTYVEDLAAQRRSTFLGDRGWKGILVSLRTLGLDEQALIGAVQTACQDGLAKVPIATIADQKRRADLTTDIGASVGTSDTGARLDFTNFNQQQLDASPLLAEFRRTFPTVLTRIGDDIDRGDFRVAYERVAKDEREFRLPPPDASTSASIGCLLAEGIDTIPKLKAYLLAAGERRSGEIWGRLAEGQILSGVAILAALGKSPPLLPSDPAQRARSLPILGSVVGSILEAQSIDYVLTERVKPLIATLSVDEQRQVRVVAQREFFAALAQTDPDFMRNARLKLTVLLPPLGFTSPGSEPPDTFEAMAAAWSNGKMANARAVETLVVLGAGRVKEAMDSIRDGLLGNVHVSREMLAKLPDDLQADLAHAKVTTMGDIFHYLRKCEDDARRGVSSSSAAAKKAGAADSDPPVREMTIEAGHSSAIIEKWKQQIAEEARQRRERQGRRDEELALEIARRNHATELGREMGERHQARGRDFERER